MGFSILVEVSSDFGSKVTDGGYDAGDTILQNPDGVGNAGGVGLDQLVSFWLI